MLNLKYMRCINKYANRVIHIVTTCYKVIADVFTHVHTTQTMKNKLLIEKLCYHCNYQYQQKFKCKTTLMR